jgi:hypothetical protein
MPRRAAPAPPDPQDDVASPVGREAAEPARPAGAGAPSLAELGVAGVTRRRVAWVGLAVLAAWIVIGFAGQAAEATDASARVAAAQAEAAAAAATTAALQSELQLVSQERWYLQQARQFQLGSPDERPFALAPDAPSLPPDAPGSEARRLGAEAVERSPLEAWLEILFGPDPGS